MKLDFLPAPQKPWIPISYASRGKKQKPLLKVFHESAPGVIWTVSEYQYQSGIQRPGAALPEDHKVKELLVLRGTETVFQGMSRYIPVVLLELAAKGIKDGLSIYIRSVSGWHEHRIPPNFIQALHGLAKFDVADYPKPIYGTPVPKPNGRRAGLLQVAGNNEASPVVLVAELLEIAGHDGKVVNDFIHYRKVLDTLFQDADWHEFVRRGNSRKYRENYEQKEREMRLQREVAISEFTSADNNDPRQSGKTLLETSAPVTLPNLPESTEDAVAALLAGLPDPSTTKAPLAEPAKEPASDPTPLAEPAQEPSTLAAPSQEQAKEPAPNPLKTAQNSPNDSPNPTPTPYRYDPCKSLLTEDLYYNAGTDDFEIFEIDEEELEKRKQQQEEHLKTVRNIYQLWLSRHMDAMGIRTPPEYGEVERGKTPPNRRWYLKNIEHMNSDQKIGEFFVPFDQFRRHYEIDPATWEERLAYSDDNRWIKGQEPEVCKKEAEERKAAAQERALAKKQEQEALQERIKRNLAEED